MAGKVRKRTRANRQGEFKVTWLADYYDQHGIRHRRTFDTWTAADDWLTTTRSDVKAGIHTPDAKSITVKEAAEKWLRACAANELERGSLRVYDQYVRLYIAEHLGRTKLSRLTAPMVVEFRDKLLRETSRYRARRVITALRLILAEMQRSTLVAQNVAAIVKVRKASRRDDRPLEVGIDVPSPDEVRALLQPSTGRDRARLIVAAFTGLRTSELRGLFWSDIDFDRSLLGVRRRADWWGSLGAPKSQKGHRDIPMIPLVANALKEWRLASPPAKPGEFDLLFPGRGGRVMSHTSVREGFGRIQCTAGVTRLDVDGSPQAKYAPHKLRHFFASWMIDQGASEKELQELMGHDTSTRTVDLYGHWFRDDSKLHARMAAAEAAFFGHHRGS
jgi:integrase